MQGLNGGGGGKWTFVIFTKIKINLKNEVSTQFQRVCLGSSGDIC